MGPLERHMREPASGPISSVSGPDLVDVLAARKQRDLDAADAAAYTRAEVLRRLRLRCMEMALEAQRQNAGEVLSTDALQQRAEMIYSFVNKSSAVS